MNVPGSLKSHYAPGTPLVMGTAPVNGQRCGFLAWHSERAGFEATEVLTPSGDPREAAARLYAGLRRLDSRGLDLIVAEPPPAGELARAIADRLLKAAAAALPE